MSITDFTQALEINDLTPCLYVGERGDVLTTGCYVTKNDESNIHEQLKHEIANIEGERVEDLMIINQVDHWSVGVPGRFTPIGRIYALAMLDPEWRP